MVIVGRNTRNDYGQMKHWTDRQDARWVVYSGQGVHPGHGLQILRIHEIIYAFSHGCDYMKSADGKVNAILKEPPHEMIGLVLQHLI